MDAPEFKIADAAAIKAHIAEGKAVAPSVSTSATLVYLRSLVQAETFSGPQ